MKPNKNRRKRNKTRRLKFRPKEKIILFEKINDERFCVINPEPQLLFEQCQISHNRIFNIINRYSIHRILSSNNFEESIRIRDNRVPWYKDRSPILLLEKLKNSMFLSKFINIFNNKIVKNQRIGQIKSLDLNNGRFNIHFDSVIRRR